MDREYRRTDKQADKSDAGDSIGQGDFRMISRCIYNVMRMRFLLVPMLPFLGQYPYEYIAVSTY